MISISVSEAVAYDMLSIATLKLAASQNASPSTKWTAEDNVVRLMKEIGKQVGENKHRNVMWSDEYLNLYRVNRKLFDSFDWLHGEGLTAEDSIVKKQAIETDRINGVDRPAAKRALQEKWFPFLPFEEQKMGYGEGKG